MQVRLLNVAATLVRRISDAAKDSVDLVRRLRSVARRCPPQPSPAQPAPRPLSPDGGHRLLHRRPLLPPPDLSSRHYRSATAKPRFKAASNSRLSRVQTKVPGIRRTAASK